MANLKPLVSVIIPIYNVEKYLDDCLESIINQTYKDLEIILINDGSTDRSLDIAETYVNKDKRVKLINQKGQGVAMARNNGLDKMDGQYIMFLDSDDKISKDAIEILLRPIKGKTHIFSMARYSTQDTLSDHHENIEIVSIKGEMINRIKAVQSSGYPSFSPWGKLYSRDIFENIRFPNLAIHEDTSIILPVIEQADEIVLVNQPLWYYRQVVSSLTNIKISQKNYDIFEKNSIQIEFAKEKYPEILNYVYKLCMNENDFIMMKCIRDGSNFSMILFNKLFQQNQEFATISKQRRALYWNINLYKGYLKLSILLYNNEFIRGLAKKILT